MQEFFVQGDGQDINMGDASAPTTSQQTTKAQGLNKGGQDIINQGQATAGAWATWRSGDPSAQVLHSDVERGSLQHQLDVPYNDLQ